ncbi:hypothetical protein CEP53_006487 [Fusarium sp. AF-6]|nr:hypothetical protein CEP53_006487 [Fusarium sp. AF-6]
MAEALAALGVAANVLQFIECGYRIVKAAQELKADKDEFMLSTGETEMLAKSLNLTLGQIQTGCAIPIPPHLSTTISTCIELSEKLGRLLDDIKVPPKEKPIWKRIQAWFKTYTKVDEIKSLDNRLTLLRTNICDQLNLGLLVLRSLHFRQIKERISDVHSAHPTTLKWIFGNSPEANVAEWMSSTDNKDLYWISGYAGSGKSTLMKFLVNHQRTIQLLKEWSGDNPLIVANHFFWSAGTLIQKSQEGLFRTLLFQIMLRDVDLIPVLCPNRWATNSFEHLEPWTRTELLETFQRLADLTTRKTRICLFIDGLDEYRGDHRELLSVLFKISKAPHLKVCASSRPWIEFRQAFEASQWKLSVQDLTAEDIRKYCMNKLCPAEPAYAWMECHNKVAAGVLANEICRKAQGVFLWVFLVVRSLLKGLSNGDSMRDLQERLEELPSDLEAYFRLMLDNIDTVYRRRTAKVFQSLVHTNSSLPVLLFHFFDIEESNPNYALDNSITPMRDSQALPIVRAKRTQLIAQCKDLVQFSCDTHEPAMLRDRVSFLHRTVSDFFRKDSMDKLLSERVGQGFEPRLTLARAYLAMIKSVPPWWLERSVIRPERVHRFAKNTGYYIGQLERLDMTSDTEPIRQELKRTLDTLQLERKGESQ